MSFLKEEIIRFLATQQVYGKKVLIGLSGGTDSLALFYLLLELQKKFRFDLGVAHIDHGWRKESAWELSRLRELAILQNLPFHGLRIDPAKLKGNLEDACREIRLDFFRSACQKYGYQSVLLGHHADDLAETVLKRIFEGTGINNLACIKPKSFFNGLEIWRPLLKIKKSALEEYLADKKIVPFEDSTNLDSRFLRGRMRSQLLPSLCEVFGKSIRSSLCRLSEEAEQMELFLEAHLRTYLKMIEIGPFGQLLDLTEKIPQTEWELGKLVQLFVKGAGCRLSHDQFRQVVQKLSRGEADCHFHFGNDEIVVDRKKIFIIKPVTPQQTVPLQEITGGIWGNWEITLEEGLSEADSFCSWKNCWKGSFEVTLPKKNYEVGFADQAFIYTKDKSLKDWWTSNKVPSFLKKIVPVIWYKKEIVHEFLTGRSKNREKGQVRQRIVFKHSSISLEGSCKA